MKAFYRGIVEENPHFQKMSQQDQDDFFHILFTQEAPRQFMPSESNVTQGHINQKKGGAYYFLLTCLEVKQSRAENLINSHIDLYHNSDRERWKAVQRQVARFPEEFGHECRMLTYSIREAIKLAPEYEEKMRVYREENKGTWKPLTDYLDEL